MPPGYPTRHTPNETVYEPTRILTWDRSVMEVSMHCPSCGTKASGDQKFCRSCGMSLEKVCQLLTEELSTTELNLQNRLYRIERWRNIVGRAAFATIGIVLLAVFIREIKVDIEKGSPELWPTLIGLVILIGLMADRKSVV